MDPRKGLHMDEDQKQCLRTIAGWLRKIDPVVEIPGEDFFLPVEGGTVFVGTTTTYTLSLMLEGMILEDERRIP